MFPGFPLALLLDRMLRGIESPVVHVAAFLAFFTLLPAIPLGCSLGDDWIQAYGYSSLLGICAAIGRAAAFRRGRCVPPANHLGLTGKNRESMADGIGPAKPRDS